MELTQVNQAQVSNVNNLSFLRSQSVQDFNQNTQTTGLKTDRIELNSISQSSFSIKLTSSISKISNLQSVQNSVTSALNTVNNFESLVKNNQNSLDSVQPQIQGFIATFNSASKSLSENMNQIIEEKQSDESRAYFDGILGSKPLSGEEIYEAINQQKQRLMQFNQQLNNQILETTQQAKQSINLEKDSSPFFGKMSQNIDFGKESVSFEAKVVQNQSGSMVDTQANATPAMSTELLAVS